MLLSIYLFVALLAVAGSGLAMRTNVDWLTRLLGAMFSAVLWAVWAMASFGVEKQTDTSLHTFEYPQLAGVGTVAAIIMGIFVLQLGLAALREDASKGIEPDTTLDYSDR